MPRVEARMKKLVFLLLSLAALTVFLNAQVMDDFFKQRILTISEDDFWSSLMPSKELEKTIAAGQAGKRDLAYRLLGKYHSRTLAVEADAYRERVAADLKDASSLQTRRRAAARV